MDAMPTPGPWTATPVPGAKRFPFEVTAGDGAEICLVVPIGDYENGQNYAAAKANAELIARVPELAARQEMKANLTAEIVLLKELLEAEKIKAGIFYKALEQAGAPLAGAYPHRLYEWADRVKQNNQAEP